MSLWAGLIKDRNVSLSDKGYGMTPSMTTSRIGRGAVDELVREQIRSWIRYEMKDRQIDSIREMAKRIHCSHSYLARVLNREASPGLELCLRLRQYLHVSIDHMADGPPPS